MLVCFHHRCAFVLCVAVSLATFSEIHGQRRFRIFCAPKVNSAHDVAVKKLQKAGAEVALHRGRAVSLSVWPDRGETILFNDEDLANVRWLPHLTNVDLDAQVTDAGIVHLINLPNLKGLTLFGAPVTDKAIATICKFPNLTNLSLTGTQVTDAGMRDLGGMTQLTFLNLSGTTVTDAGLAELKSLTRLTDFHLSFTNITSNGLVHLKQFKHLEHVSLSDVEITKAGVKYLNALPKLRGLSLEKTEMSDELVDALVELKKDLEWLSLYNSFDLDEKKLAKLKRALPKTQIDHGYVHD